MFIVFISWFCLGLYGLYVLLSPKEMMTANSQPNEMTVRIIREIIVKSEIEGAKSALDITVDNITPKEDKNEDLFQFFGTLDEFSDLFSSTCIDTTESSSKYKKNEKIPS